VGKRGWENEQTFRELDLTPDLQRHVFEVSSLPSPHLRSLIKNAQALLMPASPKGTGCRLSKRSRSEHWLFVRTSPFSRGKPEKGAADIPA
jgi:hypothetical protein